MSNVEHQISVTLGDHVGDYDIAGITAEIRRIYGPVSSIDEIHGPAYWAIVERHDRTERVKA